MDVVRTEPLGQFPAVRTRDVDELRQRLSSLYSVRSVDLGRGTQGSFEGHLNHREMHDIGLTYARYGSPISASLSHTDFYVQGFPLRGNGSFVVDGAEGLVSRQRGVVGGPGADMSLRYSSEFEHLILRIKPQGLVKKLSALIGRPVDPPLKVSNKVELGPEKAEAQLRLLQFVLGEFGRDDEAVLPPLVLAELEQALIVAYLCTNRHNYSHLLDGQPRASAPWQMRRVEEYIEQNWDQPLTIEALALVANTSVRSLFYSFKKNRGVSPMTFVKQVRVGHAKEMLTKAGPTTSVTSVAFECGFSNLGHFAKYYHNTFGERPSDTLRMSYRDERRR